jgi:hypothetical protein
MEYRSATLLYKMEYGSGVEQFYYIIGIWKWSRTVTLEGRVSLMLDGVTTEKVPSASFVMAFGGTVELVH